MTADPGNQTAAALKWLYEMEAIDSPVLRANLYENIFLADRGIVDCAAWITPTFTYQKGVLIWVKLGWRTKWFGKEIALSRIKGVVKGLLPSYEIRIVEDRNILEMAQKKVEEVYGEKVYEKSDTDNISDDDNNSLESSIEGDGLSETSNILPNSEKQAEDKQEIRTEAKQLDPQVEQKAQDLIEDIYSDPDAGK